jgi:glycine cleavage system aminomethyltransferase T
LDKIGSYRNYETKWKLVKEFRGKKDSRNSAQGENGYEIHVKPKEMR